MKTKDERKFNIGAELDKQIYKEGEPTWGCKSGVLDVEDVKEAVKELKEVLLINGTYHREINDKIDEIFGKELVE